MKQSTRSKKSAGEALEPVLDQKLVGQLVARAKALSFDAEIRKIICTTNAIESVNARIRKAVRARGHFPNDQTTLKRV